MLSVEEFRRLPDKEKEERYKELSSHDRFLWRISCPTNFEIVKNSDITPEQRKRGTEIRIRLLNEGKISQERFDELENE